jgi:RNA polymerase sigma factor (sigma-70 family)
MDRDTALGAGHSHFPETRVSVVEGAASHGEEARRTALTTLIESYWRPVYKYIRIRHRLDNEDAKDLTQAFFAVAMEKNYFGLYDRRRAAFRTFLRSCIDHFVLNSQRREHHTPAAYSVKFDDAASELPSAESLQPDELFQREWQREVFTRSVNQLREDCAATGRTTQFQVFRRFVLDGDCSYADIAQELHLAETTVTNYLSAMRREFRRVAGQFIEE